MNAGSCPGVFRVVVNDEGCYCIWPMDAEVPPGWRATGFSSSGAVALCQVAELWRDRKRTC